MSENLAELPEGWVWTRLGEIRLNFSTSITPNKFPRQMFELYSVPKFDSSEPEILPGKDIGSNKYVVKKDTVLLCKINPRINRVWIVGDYSKFLKIASTEWIPFFKIEGIYPKYLCFYMQLSNFREYLVLNVSGVGGSLMRIKPDIVGKFSIPLPPLPEQNRIVNKIEELFTKLDAGVEALQKIKAQLKRYRQSVLKSAMEGKLTEEWREAHKDELEPASVLLEKIKEERKKKLGKKYKELPPVDTSDLNDLPEGWFWTRLENLCHSISDGDHQAPPKSQEGIPFLVISNINAGILNFNKTRFVPLDYYKSIPHNRKPVKGDILYSLVGSYGIPVLVNDERKFCFQRHIGLIRPLETKTVDTKYIFIFLKSDFAYNQATEAATGTAQLTVPLSGLRKFNIALPPLPEQHQIVQEIERLFSVADSVEKTVDENLLKAERLRQSILKNAFNGKLVPQDPKDEPASVLLERIKQEKTKREAEEKAKKKVARKGKKGSKKVKKMKNIKSIQKRMI